MWTSVKLRWYRERLEAAFDAWRVIPLPPEGWDPSVPAPAPNVLVPDQFASLARVPEKVAEAFLERKAAEFDIKGIYVYFQGGPYWTEYVFPKKPQ